jgi:hypothetical protein
MPGSTTVVLRTKELRFFLAASIVETLPRWCRMLWCKALVDGNHSYRGVLARDAGLRDLL